MYNHTLKEQFLDWRGSAVDRCTGIFNRIADYENELHKDVLDMTTQEYHDCLKAANESFMTGFIEVFRLTQGYGMWAQQERHQAVCWVDCCDMYEAYLADANFPEVWLWDDIYSELLSVYPITEGFAIWPIIVFGWLGLTLQECCKLRNEDVDLKEKTICVDGRKIHIETDTQWKILAAYAHTTEGLRTQNRTFTVGLVDQGFFLKVTRTKNSKKVLEPLDKKKLYQTFDQYAKKCIEEQNRDPVLTFSTIAKMGSYHQLWIQDKQIGRDLNTMSTREIQVIFHIKGVTPTRKMLLTEYQLYLRKLEERSRT